METAEEWADSRDFDRGFTDAEVSLHYVAAGPREAETVLLLHGFPEFWYTWRHQLQQLAEQFRVVAPDLRGYNVSDRPDGVAAYRLDALREDLFDLVQDVGAGTVHLVGHDWGGAVALSFARHHPGHVRRLVVENALDPERLGAQLRSRQLLRSWDGVIYQLPRIPERLLAADDYRSLSSRFESAADGDAFTEDDIRRFRATWERDGALTAALNHYRALARSTLKGAVPLSRRHRVIVPALLLWGENDPAIAPGTAERVAAGIDDPELRRLGCGHWPHVERADAVTEALIAFLDGAEV